MSASKQTSLPKRGLSPREETQLQEGLSNIDNDGLKKGPGKNSDEESLTDD